MNRFRTPMCHDWSSSHSTPPLPKDEDQTTAKLVSEVKSLENQLRDYKETIRRKQARVDQLLKILKARGWTRK